MGSLVCHRCGYISQIEGEVACPVDRSHLITPAEHEKNPRDLYLGTLIGGRYPVLGKIGAGGMGAVYKSIQPLVNREVAIKVILPASPHEAEDAKKRFLREAQTIAHLNHPFLVTLYDFGAERDGTLYMVMEYVVGKTLTYYLRNNLLHSKQLIRIILSVLDALDYAHRRGCIHRDIKPDNIMVLDDQARSGELPQIKLLDFGLAKLLGSSQISTITQAGVVYGTPQYMSPEQATGEELDERTDIYSLAVILYEGLAGRPPFQADHPMRLAMMRVMSDPAPLPPMPHLVPGLREVLSRSLARRKLQRFTAAEMTLALRQLPLGQADLPLPPPGQPAPTRPTPPPELVDLLPAAEDPAAAARRAPLPAPPPGESPDDAPTSPSGTVPQGQRRLLWWAIGATAATVLAAAALLLPDWGIGAGSSRPALELGVPASGPHRTALGGEGRGAEPAGGLEPDQTGPQPDGGLIRVALDPPEAGTGDPADGGATALRSIVGSKPVPAQLKPPTAPKPGKPATPAKLGPELSPATADPPGTKGKSKPGDPVPL